MNGMVNRWSLTGLVMLRALVAFSQYSARPQVAFDEPIRIAGVVPIGALISESVCKLEVRIAVDRNGNVTNAAVVWRMGLCSNSLIAAAVAQAKEYRFNPDPTAPQHQNGTVTWDFQAFEPTNADLGTTGEQPVPSIQEDWYTFTDPMPQFPGGEEAFKAYLATNLRYPDMEREQGIEGTVYLSIIVEDNGVVTNVTVLRGVNGGPGLEKEAKRVLKAMPPWTPGRVNGKPVRVKMNVPVRFKLE